MSTSIIILIAAIWIVYGFIAMIQSKDYIEKMAEKAQKNYMSGTTANEVRLIFGFLFGAGAPVVFVIRCLHGAFKKYS
ncbi:MAG: hypothetical protein AABY15_02930 [Nanoarchaeota archaeon]